MGQRDAFGREIGDDPLAEMGLSDPVAPEPESAPEPAPEREWAPEPGPVEPVRVRTIRLGWLPKLLFFGAVLAVIAAIAVPVVSSVVDAVEDIETPSFTTDSPSPGRVDEKAQPPRGLQRRSMLLRGNLAPAMRQMQREMGGELRYVRIEAERVDVQVTKGGQNVAAQARWDGEPQVFDPTPGAGGTSTFPWSAVDASAPRRFVEAVTRKAGRPSSQFNYAVLIDAAGLRWQVFLRDGTHYTASPDGREVNRV